MKVRELKELISTCSDDSEIEIDIDGDEDSFRASFDTQVTYDGDVYVLSASQVSSEEES